MRIKTQDDILKPEIRKAIIQEIEGPENRRRKAEHYRRQLCYKDQTPKFVVQNLIRQFDTQTVDQMQYAVANISIVRKIIGKLARVYDANVTRQVMIGDVVNEEAKALVEQAEKEFSFNHTMQELNRMVRLHLQSLLYIKPCVEEDGKNDLALQVLTPYLYDAVENHYDRTKPMAFILSNFDPQDYDYIPRNSAIHAQSALPTAPQGLLRGGDQKDQLIADKKEDEGKDGNSKQYIWWTDKYHFTTNAQGDIIDEDSGSTLYQPPPEKIANPIGEMPMVNFAVGQDNSFWAVGGDDLSMQAILINSMLTHINHIGVTQGYGQFYMTGKDLPKNLKIGPSKGIAVEYTKDDPVPSIGFASSNPQLAELRNLVETHVALLLTTNNLSTSGVRTQLGGTLAATSGIALVIDKAESLEDVNDQRALYINKEPCIWKKIALWQDYFGDTLDEDMPRIPSEAVIVPSFGQQPMIETESERLDNIQKRKDLGLNTMAELLKIDQPELTDDQANEKLKKISEEKVQRMDAMTGMAADNGAQNVDQGNQNQGQPNDPSVGAGPIQ